MKTSKIDRIVSVVVIGTCLIKAVLYGGSKPSATTNTPSGDVSCPTKMVGRGVLDAPQPTTNENAFICGCGAPGGRPLPLRTVATPQQKENEPSTIHNSSLILQNSWYTRGAFCDWTRVDFPSSFAFPCGTNLITSVTLMSYGEIRENLRCSPSTFTSSLPLPVSLEPGVSTCAYGLTASNSFVFAWQDACVEREGTNRVDAAIELFASGDVQVRFGESVTNIVARPPEGFVGEGQDAAWVTNAFQASAADIAEKGYEDWLMEDCVGINEPNGRYKLSVTVSELPEHGPCYLVVGPYRMVVTAPGTYSFPLEVFEHYKARTYPVAVPLTFEYDDGYRSEETQSNPCLQSPPRRLLGLPLIFPPIYDIFQEPRFVITPCSVPLDEAPGTEVSLWCNIAGEVQCYCRSLWRTTKVIFRGSREAEVVEAIIADEVDFILQNAKGSCSATLSITPSPHPCCPDCCDDDCHCDGTCCDCNCGCHSSGNSNTNAPPNVSQP